MLKLIVQIVVAGLIGFGCSALDLPWWAILIALVAGVVIVSWIWERIFVSPFVHLGAMPVANDDPLIVSAIERAKATWPDFLAIYPEHREDSVVKFRMQTTDGEFQFEQLWGDLLEIDGDDAVVYLRTPPVGPMDIDDRRMTIPLSTVVDWQIEFRDGTLRGGFTQQATFRIFARENGYMPPEFEEQLQRYRDL